MGFSAEGGGLSSPEVVSTWCKSCSCQSSCVSHDCSYSSCQYPLCVYAPLCLHISATNVRVSTWNIVIPKLCPSGTSYALPSSNVWMHHFKLFFCLAVPQGDCIVLPVTLAHGTFLFPFFVPGKTLPLLCQMSNSNSTSVFQELLDEVEVGNCKFIKPHIVKVILQWLVRFADSVEQVAADLEGIDLDEDDESDSEDTGERKSGDSSSAQDFTDDDLEAMESASASLLTNLSSAGSSRSSHLTPTSEQEEMSELSSLTDVATVPREHRTPQQVRLLQEYHPLGRPTGVNLDSSRK